MGSGNSKIAPNPPRCEIYRKPDSYPLQPEVNNVDSCKGEKAVDTFMNRMITNGNRKDMITSLLSNEQSRHYFIDFMKNEFAKDKLIVNSWEVFWLLFLNVVDHIHSFLHQDIEREIMSNQQLHDKYRHGMIHDSVLRPPYFNLQFAVLGMREVSTRRRRKSILQDTSASSFKQSLDKILASESNKRKYSVIKDDAEVTEKCDKIGEIEEDDMAVLVFMSMVARY
jgi:hypothetical protein